MEKRLVGWLAGLCMLVALFSGIPMVAQAEEADLFLSYPSSSKFDSLWVGGHGGVCCS